MNIALILSIALTFTVTFLLLPWWIRRSKRAGLVGRDMNKVDRKKVAESGGFPVILGFSFGLLLYTGHLTFFQTNSSLVIPVLGTLGTVLLVFIIGLLDDILGWKLGITLSQKVIFTMFAALPLMMTNAGKSNIVIPLIGNLELGIIYPLVVIPLAITFASNGFNILAGYNGLEAGMGIIILGIMSFSAYIVGKPYVSMLGAMMIVCLAAFYLYNRYPSRIFPGDSLTYPVGALIAIMAILGDLEKMALFLFIPYYLDLFYILKARSTKIEAFAKVNADGSLGVPKEGCNDTTHLVIHLLSKIKKVNEKDVVYTIFGIEAAIGLVAIYIWIL